MRNLIVATAAGFIAMVLVILIIDALESIIGRDCPELMKGFLMGYYFSLSGVATNRFLNKLDGQ